MSEPECIPAGVAWRAVARRNTLRAKLIGQSTLTASLSVAPADPLALDNDDEEGAPTDEACIAAVDAIEEIVAARLLTARTDAELDVAIEAVLEDEHYLEARVEILDMVACAAPTEEDDDPLGALLPCAGIENQEVFVAASRILQAIAVAQRQCRELWAAHVEEDSDAMHEIRKLVESPIPTLMETRSMPAAMKQALYSGFCLDVLVFAIGASCDREIPPDTLRALVHRLFLEGRQFLRLLAGVPGVTRPAVLADGESLDFQTLAGDHALSERAYQERLQRARAVSADVYPARVAEPE